MYMVPIFLGSVEVSHSFQSQPQRLVLVEIESEGDGHENNKNRPSDRVPMVRNGI